MTALLAQFLPSATFAYSGDSAREAQLALSGTSSTLVIIDTHGDSPEKVLDSISRLSQAGSPIVALCPQGFRTVLPVLLDAGANCVVSSNSSTEDFVKACRQALAGNIWFARELIDSNTHLAPRIELSAQQRRALALYTSGMTMDAVARHMGISTSTAKDYIDRVRTKYGKTGVNPRTKTELYVAAKRDGLIA